LLLYPGIACLRVSGVVERVLITRLRELCASECTLPWAVHERPHMEQRCGFSWSWNLGHALLLMTAAWQRQLPAHAPRERYNLFGMIFGMSA